MFKKLGYDHPTQDQAQAIVLQSNVFDATYREWQVALLHLSSVCLWQFCGDVLDHLGVLPRSPPLYPLGVASFHGWSMLVADPLAALLLTLPASVPECIAFSTAVNAVSFVACSSFVKHDSQHEGKLWLHGRCVYPTKDINVPCITKSLEPRAIRRVKANLEGYIGCFATNNTDHCHS